METKVGVIYLLKSAIHHLQLLPTEFSVFHQIVQAVWLLSRNAAFNLHASCVYNNALQSIIMHLISVIVSSLCWLRFTFYNGVNCFRRWSLGWPFARKLA